MVEHLVSQQEVSDLDIMQAKLRDDVVKVKILLRGSLNEGVDEEMILAYLEAHLRNPLRVRVVANELAGRQGEEEESPVKLVRQLSEEERMEAAKRKGKGKGKAHLAPTVPQVGCTSSGKGTKRPLPPGEDEEANKRRLQDLAEMSRLLEGVSKEAGRKPLQSKVLNAELSTQRNVWGISLATRKIEEPQPAVEEPQLAVEEPLVRSEEEVELRRLLQDNGLEDEGLEGRTMTRCQDDKVQEDEKEQDVLKVGNMVGHARADNPESGAGPSRPTRTMCPNVQNQHHECTEFCLRRWGATTAAAVQVIPKQTAVRRQEPKYSPDVLLLAEGLSEIFPTTPVDYLRYCCLDLVGNEAIQERLTLELLETGVPKSP